MRATLRLIPSISVSYSFPSMGRGEFPENQPCAQSFDVPARLLQVFVNASTSDVVATTSIEALAMGKWLVCAHHPCNSFAAQFSNTLIYHTPTEFCEHLQYALEHDPHPMDSDTLRQGLTLGYSPSI